ncbi:MAG TPA: polyphenol oxidase family protein [Thermoanaerobaculia bacterium]|nr:polyphenol oxidase family protein [Thermoanaerobaculia bacterium]
MKSDWKQSRRNGLLVFEPAHVPRGVLVAFSGRGVAPAAAPSPTEFLARRFADALALDGAPIVRATQVHGRRSALVAVAPDAGSVSDAGPCDILATALSGVALAVQTADCVPILLAGRAAVATAHAGWRGTSLEAAAAAVTALTELGEAPPDILAWLGPSIGACCYEVGPEIEDAFDAEFRRPGQRDRSHLDLPAANRAQLQAAGLADENIHIHPACTRCGGEELASYRRDGTRAGRMIGLIARLS